MPIEAKRLLLPIILVIGSLVALFVGLGGGSERISSNREFLSDLKQVQDTAIPLLVEVDQNNGEMTLDQRRKLESLHPRLEKLLRFNQKSIVAAFIAGKVNAALGNHETAAKWLRQSIENAEPRKEKLDVSNTQLEARRLLSEVYVHMGEYDEALKEADLALAGKPDAPDYLVTRASALVQLGRASEARRDLRRALQLDPAHRRAAGLLDFLDHGV